MTETGVNKDIPCIYPGCPPRPRHLSSPICMFFCFFFIFWEEIHFTLGYNLLKKKTPRCFPPFLFEKSSVGISSPEATFPLQLWHEIKLIFGAVRQRRRQWRQARCWCKQHRNSALPPFGALHGCLGNSVFGGANSEGYLPTMWAYTAVCR